MTNEERSLVCSRLESSLLSLQQVTEDLSATQWCFKPSETSWSASQCAEHLAEVENSVNNRIQIILNEGFSDPKLCAEAEGKEGLLGRAVPSRTRLANAPKQPDNNPVYATQVQALAILSEIRAGTLQFAQTTEAALEKHVFPHFLFGQLNLYQWLFLLSLHSERHTAQIQEIKANPEFPKA